MGVTELREKITQYVRSADEQHLSVIYRIIEDGEKGANTLEQQFTELATRWKAETGLFSTTPQKVFNDAYIDIIAMGKVVVPFILKDLENGAGHWHTALKALTRENPISDADMTSSKKIREGWLTWGRNHGLI
jgi:hypothetical protein